MGHRVRRNLKKSRVATHFPSLREEDDLSSNVLMFVEDVQLLLMPIVGRPHKTTNFTVEIQGNREYVDSAIAILKSLTDYDRYSETELLSSVVEGIARQLAWNGRAVHEIVWDEDNGGAYRLCSFTSRRLFHAFGRYIQIIPKADRNFWNKAIIIIPEKYVWDVAMPKVLGGYRGYRAILRRLARIQLHGPSFFRKELFQQRWPAYYDSQRYIREAKYVEAKITAQWGWTQRGISQSSCTEFYLFHRIIQFKWAQAVVREHIVNELNRLLRRLRVDAEIVVKGLPTASKILAIQRKMSKGDISFKEASDACSV